MGARRDLPTDMIPIKGPLITWARDQKGLTLRQVHELGGPSPSYQCEVEKGRKREVSQRQLRSWLAILGVDEGFVRGLFPRYHENPGVYPGPSAATANAVRLRRSEADWDSMGSQERLRALLLVLLKSGGWTDPVLAYILGWDVAVLDGVLTGDLPITKDQIGAICTLAGVQEQELLCSVSEPAVLAAFQSVVLGAYAKGFTPETLQQVIDQYLGAQGRQGAAHVSDPYP